MSVRRLLDPRSIAIVGASDRVGPGFNAWNALKAVGFDGAIHLVNPSRESLFGQPCFASLKEAPAGIDAVFVAVPAERVLDVVEQAADIGCGGLAILSSGFGEAGSPGAGAQGRLEALARAGGLAVCGPNCLGFLNFRGRAALFGTSLPADPPVGGVAAVVQSGSVGIALLNSARGIGFSHLITSGNEAVTTAADFLEVLVDDPRVTTLAVFLEQLRAPLKFVEVCRRAKAMGKPVVVLKSGRTPAGQSAVLAHTGAVAGSVEACDAAFREAGVIQVFSLDELVESTLLSSRLPRPLTGRGAAMVSLSGGEIALALDAADEIGLRLPPVSASRAALTGALPAGLAIANPLDLSWAGLYDPRIAGKCAAAFALEPDAGLLILLQDAPMGLGTQQAGRYAALLDAVADGARKAGLPLVTVSNISGDTHPDYARVAAEKSAVGLRGTREGLAAIARHLAWQAAPLPPAAATALPDPGVTARIAAHRQRSGRARVLDEVEGRALLAPYGLSPLRERLVDDAAQAEAAADEIGGRVVLKALVPGVAHKTELGLVRLGIGTPRKAGEAARELLARVDGSGLGAGVRILVQEMVDPVVELLVGGRTDPQFGPVVVVGGGGLTVELFRDVAVRLAPVTPEVAAEMISATRTGRLFEGWRGRPKADLDAAATAVAALSRFIAAHQDAVAEVEINPLAVLEVGRGCRPLDCLVVLQEDQGRDRPDLEAGPRPRQA